MVVLSRFYVAVDVLGASDGAGKVPLLGARGASIYFHYESATLAERLRADKHNGLFSDSKFVEYSGYFFQNTSSDGPP